jgi:hypothetical protein
METNLLLVLLPTHETAAKLEKVQSALAAYLPLAEAWPPLIPIACLSALPPSSALMKAKAVVWPRLDLSGPWFPRIDASGCLGLPIDDGIWREYRAKVLKELAPWLAGPPLPPTRLLPEPGPLLVLAPEAGDGPLPVLALAPLVVHAPFLAVVEFTSGGGPGPAASLEWRLMASHRVCKER